MEITRFNTGIELLRDANQSLKVRGLASPYYDGTPKTEYRLWGNTFERMAKGCWDEALANAPDCFARVNHNRERNLGRTPKTLRLWADNRGLNFEVDLGTNTIARDAIDQIERGELMGCSYKGYTDLKNAANAKWIKEGDKTICLITRMERLMDVSVVDSPAFVGTECALYRDSYEAFLKDEETKKRLEILHMLRLPK